MLDQAILAVPVEDGGLLGSHMVGTVRAVVVQAQTRAAPSCQIRGFNVSHSVVTGAVCMFIVFLV